MINFKNKVEYPEGSILHDVRYHYKPECFEVVYYNPLTKQLEVEYEKPIIDIWFLKKEYRELYLSPYDNKPYQASQVPREQLYSVSCKPSQIPKVIADNMADDEWCSYYKEYYYKNNGQISNKEMKDYMCTCPWVFKADFVPDVYFRLKWIQKYGPECDVSYVTFGLIDIETDVIDRALDMKKIHEAPQPINAISIILPHVKICALLVLGPRPKHLLHEKFHDLLAKQEKAFHWLNNNMDEFKRKIVEFDPDNQVYLKDYEIRVHIFDFKDEIKMIKTAYDYINKYRPMFVMSWNAKFDHNYMPERIKHLGYDPKDIIIPKDFKTDMLYYKEDKSKDQSAKNSKDWMFSSTYSVYLCQMKLFAAERKSQSELRSLSLSYVGRKVAGIDKLTNTKSGAFREFAYTNFIKFLLYNVRDTVVQLAIELNCNDCKSLFSRSYTFATQYSKCFQETHIVRGISELSYEENGDIMACRLLIDPTMDSQFKGAFVAPTEKNAPTGYILNGKNVNNIIFGAMDADAASYYPSTKMGMNMDPMTLLYKCRINNQVFFNDCLNRSFNQEYVWYDSKKPPKAHDEDMSGPIINSYKNGNISSLMYNWFGLPSIGEYFQYIDSLI